MYSYVLNTARGGGCNNNPVPVNPALKTYLPKSSQIYLEPNVSVQYEESAFQCVKFLCNGCEIL